MGFLSRLLIPRKARRAVHPVRAVKRAATPRSVKRVTHAMHPVSNARYSVERSISTQIRSGARGGRKQGRSGARTVASVKPSTGSVYRHGNCPVRHRSAEAAARCRNG
jgi:hypothetical protein